ncbi:MAG: DUF1573 domain-containing protein [Flavobacteriales bacterium]|nr:DUF1573 domain-containing protein [Flavobacteriales bacterium]
MSKIILILFILLNSALTWSQAEFQFNESTHKFPKTEEGVLLEHDYTFTNTGTEPLIISEIKVSCSCTKFTYPKEPILPGQMGTIHVTFDTKDKSEFQNRTLSIYSNTKKSPEKIRFKVLVISHK